MHRNNLKQTRYNPQLKKRLLNVLYFKYEDLVCASQMQLDKASNGRILSSPPYVASSKQVKVWLTVSGLAIISTVIKPV